MNARDNEQDEEQTVPAVEAPPGPWRWVEVGGGPMAYGSSSGSSAESTELIAADGTPGHLDAKRQGAGGGARGP